MDAVSNGAHDLTCAVSSVAHRVMADALWLVGDAPEGPPLSVPKLSRADITQEMAAASKEAAGAMLRGACRVVPAAHGVLPASERAASEGMMHNGGTSWSSTTLTCL